MKEEADRDRFISYLKATEDMNYVPIAENVKNSAGDRNFDYLLRADTGELLALEITLLTDKDETHPDKNQHHDFLEGDQKVQILFGFLSSLISKQKLPGSLLIGVPYYVPLTRKELNRLIENNVESIKNQLAVIQNLSVGDSITVTTDLCHLAVECTREGDSVILHSVGGHRGGIFDVEYFAAKIKNKIPRKNLQLDYPANRRVLLIRNTIPLTFASAFTKLVIPAAITDFIAASPSDIKNIDEIYVDFKLGEIERIHPR